MNDSTTIQPAASSRSEELFRQRQDELYRRTDRLFAKLMLFQWVAGIVAALWISPRAWTGAQSQTHLHVWAALLVGGAIASLPVLLAWKRPGQALTRHVIGCAQMLTSALLIHLTGGRIETHFHVFGSLAFLAFYRDWRVLVTATVVVAGDHILRGAFWPESVFGVLASSPWRWLEHAGWVLFEDFFLFISIRQGNGDARLLAERQAGLEVLNQGIEQQVQERTRELQLEIQERKATEARLEETHKRLLDISRKAGMAEVATSVLHNVGNVLNSVNVSCSLVTESLQKSKLAMLSKSAALLQQHDGDLPAFFASDPRGKKLPGFLGKLSAQLEQEHVEMAAEVASLATNIDHVKQIVAMQQSYAKVSGIVEALPLANLIEDAVRMNALGLERHEIKIIKDFAGAPMVEVDKHKVLQILVNLIRNAKHALDDVDGEKCITIRAEGDGNGQVKVSVIDNGVGIARENLTRIFEHGFTTRKEGHGFGLHNGALAARELGGALTVMSDGPGLGAAFTLEFPRQQKEQIA